MKKIMLFAGLFVAALTMSFYPVGSASFTWEKTTINVGQIPQDVPHDITFTFTNTGDTPLIITRTQGSCGCTATEYTKEAIPPGAQGWVKATYNAAKVGQFQKSVAVYSNVSDEPVRLALSGEVVAAD